MARVLLLTGRRFVTALTVVLPLLGMAGAGLAPAAAQPNLAVVLTSDADAVAPGDPITYSAEITNRGEAVDARVVLAPPAYIALGEADGDGVVDGNAVTWASNVPAGGTSTFVVSADVGEIPADEVRATTLVSVYVGDSTTPVVRTASADRIVGVDDAQVVEEASPLPVVLIVVGVVLVVALLVLTVVLVVVRRRRAAAAAEEEESHVGYARRQSLQADTRTP